MPIPNFDFGAFWFESRDEVNPVAKEEGRGDEEVFEVIETIRAESASAEVMDPPPGSSSAVPPPGSYYTYMIYVVVSLYPFMCLI